MKASTILKRAAEKVRLEEQLTLAEVSLLWLTLEALVVTLGYAGLRDEDFLLDLFTETLPSSLGEEEERSTTRPQQPESRRRRKSVRGKPSRSPT
jgi:hypothetical protein